MDKHQHKAESKVACHTEKPKGQECGSCGNCHTCTRIYPLPLALAAGVICGLGALSLGWSAALGDWGVAMVKAMGSVYHGYTPTLKGGMWGGLWGFMDGFVSGLLLAYLYNFFLCCCKWAKCCSKEKCKKT